MEEREWIKRADVAKMIRAELKREFTGVKFSVRSSTYSMGGSIDISWVDGPTEESVSGITSKYRDRGFDGSIDMEYQIDHYMMPDGTIGQLSSSGTTGSMGYVPRWETELPVGARRVNLNAGYVFCHREYSDALKARCLPEVPINVSGVEAEQWLWRIMREVAA